MKKLIALLGLITSISLTTPSFAETREQLGIPASGAGTLIEHFLDIYNELYYRQIDTDGDGVYDLEEVYVASNNETTYIFCDAPVIIWYDKNKNQIREPDEIFNSTDGKNWKNRFRVIKK